MVLCFGTLGEEDKAQVDATEALATIQQNFTGAVSLLTIAAQKLEAQGTGFIVVIGSVAGDRGRKRNYVYGSAKGALHLFLQGLRARLSKTKIHVMTVILGTVDTRMTWGREGTLFTVPPRARRRSHLRGMAQEARRGLCALVLASDHGRRARDPGTHLQARQLLTEPRFPATIPRLGGGPFGRAAGLAAPYAGAVAAAAPRNDGSGSRLNCRCNTRMPWPAEYQTSLAG